MDFALTDDLQALADLADRILREHGTPERLTAIEATGGPDGALWQALADTGLLGVALPETAGGGALGFLAVHVLLEAAGQHVAHAPVWDTLVGSLAVARAGDPTGVLAGVVAGETTLGLALQDVGASPYHPTTTISDDPDARRLTGTKVMVPWAGLVDHLLVTATPASGGDAVVAIVDAGAVAVTPQQLSSGVPHGRVELTDTPAVVLPDVTVTWLLERAVAGLASLQAGMLTAAVQLAATYTSEREQFGRPVATFQAVAHRVASAFIDAECARLTALQAAWRLDEGLPASEEVAIAKWWAAEAGHRVLHAAQHVHGGVGVDRDYPLHRHLLRTKQVEFALGSAADHLGRLGAALAADPA